MRLLSRSHADAIRRVTIRNAHGRYYSYGVGLTYFHRKVAERGLMDRISVIDCGLAKAGEPADCWLFDDFGVIEVEAGIDIGSLDIVRLSRDEDIRDEVDTIRVREGATISRLVLRDCEPVVAKEASGENTIYRFAPGGRPIVVQASRGFLAESETDFDRVANLARRAWNDVCR